MEIKAKNSNMHLYSSETSITLHFVFFTFCYYASLFFCFTFFATIWWPKLSIYSPFHYLLQRLPSVIFHYLRPLICSQKIFSWLRHDDDYTLVWALRSNRIQRPHAINNSRTRVHVSTVLIQNCKPTVELSRSWLWGQCAKSMDGACAVYRTQ